MANRSLGGVTHEEISEITSSIGIPTDAGASLVTRFSRRVSNLVARRASIGEMGNFSIFLQSEAIHEETRGKDFQEAPLFSNGLDPITDCVWLSSASMTAVFRIPVTQTAISDLFEAVRSAGLGNHPAVVVDWRRGTPVGQLYRAGLNDHESVEQIAFEDLPIDAGQLKSVLDRFYEHSIRTPSLGGEGHAKRVWKDPPKGEPEPRPEETIQGRLLDVLKGVFTRHELRAEPVTADGRADIIIYRKALTQNSLPAVVNEWVLELKALTDTTNTGNPVPASTVRTAIYSGVEQAQAYRLQLNAINAALCCYDMRRRDEGDQACFANVQAAAANENIFLWRWFLFRSTAESRAAKGLLTG